MAKAKSGSSVVKKAKTAKKSAVSRAQREGALRERGAVGAIATAELPPGEYPLTAEGIVVLRMLSEYLTNSRTQSINKRAAERLAAFLFPRERARSRKGLDDNVLPYERFLRALITSFEERPRQPTVSFVP